MPSQSKKLVFLPWLAIAAASLCVCLHIYDCFRDAGSFSRYIPLLVGFALCLAAVLLFPRAGKFTEGKKQLAIMTALLVIFSALYMIAVRPGETPDEGSHFFRAMQVSQGGLVSQVCGENNEIVGGWIPAILEDGTISDQLNAYDFANTALYAPTNYVVQALGIRIARCFTNQYAAVLTFTRVFSALVFVGLVVLALWLMPERGRILLFLPACLPISLQELTSIAPDAGAIALSFLLIAWVMRLREEKRAPGRREKVLLGLVAVLLSLSKVVYVVLALVVVLVPFGDKRRGLLWKSLTVGLCVLANLLWLVIAARFLNATGAGHSQQTIYVLTHLPQYVGIMLRSVFNSGSYWLETAFGQHMGALNITVTGWLPCAFAMLLCWGCASARPALSLREGERWWMAVIFLGGFVLILTSLYVQYTGYQAELIDGVQGRYFLPLLPCLLIAAVSGEKTGARETMQPTRYLLLTLIFLHVIELSDILHTYICYLGG